MRWFRMTVAMLALGAIAGTLAIRAYAKAEDEAEIKALEDRLMAAIGAKDLKAVMACYEPGQKIVIFDAIPPLQYVGAKAWSDDWAGLFKENPGPAKSEITELEVVVSGNVGFGHSIQKLELTGADGKAQSFVVRATDGYRKTKGKWLIAHEHLSVPVDLATGKAVMDAK